MSLSKIVRFEANIPALVVLKYPEGKEVEGQFGPQYFYSLQDGRQMYVNPPVAQAIHELGLKPGQPFTITKKELKQGNRKTVAWDVQRVEGEAPLPGVPIPAAAVAPSRGQDVPAQPSEDSKLTQQLQRSLVLNEAAKRADEILAHPNPDGGLYTTAKLTGFAAVDVVMEVEAYARQRGLELQFAEEDIRSVWATLFIQGAKQWGGSANQWRN